MRLLTLTIIISMVLLIPASRIQAQDIDTLWTEYYWNGYFDSANCVQQTSDDGFIVVGGALLEGEIQYDISLVKTDADGGVDWSKRIGDEHCETGYHVLQTLDGGYLVSAWSDAFGSGTGDYRVWIVKTDAAGDTTWTYPFNGLDANGFPLHAIQTADGGYAITGLINYEHNNQAFILKLNGDGTYNWHGFYGDSYHQDGWFIAQMPDNGYMVAGNWDHLSSNYDFWVMRTNESGVVMWDSTYVLTDYYDEMHAACLVDDGLVMAGLARAAGHVHKIDFDGHTVWSKPISIYATSERYNSICATSDGGLMVGGWVWVVGHRRDYCFQKLDAVGDTLWAFAVGGTQDDHGRTVVETSDGGFAMVGSSSSFEMGTVMYLVKIGDVETGVIDSQPNDLPGGFSLSRNYPNPFNPSTSFSYSVPRRSDVSLTIYNLLGQQVKMLESGSRAAGNYNTRWDGTDNSGNRMPSGVYFCRLLSDNIALTQKMMLIK